MSFFQKNRPIIVILLMIGFFIAILVTFVSGVSGSDSNPTPTGSTLSAKSVLVTSTINITPSTPDSSDTQTPGMVATLEPSASPSATEPVSSPTVEILATEVIPETATFLPPPTDYVVTDDGFPVTDFPPPLTFIPPPTETPPPGNGPPPGS